MNILDTIDSVDRIRALNDKELSQLCTELRRLIIETTLQNGGHLSSNLGVIELTVALLRCFDVPKDKIVFDVGHQSYAYKILTGRYKQFSTLRKKDGLAGFPRTSESEYDAFSAGHASTSISAGLGLARARDICGQTHHVVSVVGDGALTGGMCYEAMDDGGTVKTPFIVILNDNRMSIARSGRGKLIFEPAATAITETSKAGTKIVTIPKIGSGLAADGADEKPH
ncbi:MAG: 1-deoxy-D-xylulose-5-phosphate synthase N-terminal domain-containing protein [Christensenellales bacterium]